MAAISNAKKIIEIRKEYGNFNNYLWQFTDGKPIINNWQTIKEIPPNSKESDTMSRDMKKRGLSFAGSTICYAFMQAVGMVNDHIESCFCYQKVNKL